jgi:putative radical SAM enzyme (TIGR03279 family)
MPLKVAGVLPRSLAARAGILPEDWILSINSMPVNDFFDLEYYAADYRLELVLRDANGQKREAIILRETAKPLGIEPEPYVHRHCANNCVFCFIDQLPPGLRPSLYRKDDDYLYSYAFGNYITLNNLSPKDLNRIATQHISPLYVSVHATDPLIRRDLMRYQGGFDLLAVLKRLSRRGISFHFQIVSVPGLNDGEILANSIRDLLDGSVATLSIGVVPVGLTGFRAKLSPLRPYTPLLAGEAIRIVDEARRGKPIVYAADEFYVLAGLPVPETEYYADFPQLENGIGMLRLLRFNFARRARTFLKDLHKHGGDYLFLTSAAAAETVADLAGQLNPRLESGRIRVQTVRNRFFGGQISVSGLLTASDLISQHTALANECIVLPSNIFNHDNLTLDDYSQLDLKTALGRELLVVDQLFEDWDWL